MKQILLIGILLASTLVHAGATHIYCEGKVIRMDKGSKGPYPYPRDSALSIRGLGEPILAQYLGRHDEEDSHDFQIFYRNTEARVAAILELIDGEPQFAVYQNGELVERVACTLGF